MEKELKDISWQVDEPTYREDPSYSYSTISRYMSLGFEGLPHLFDKVTSPSLTFGSMVDTLLTDGEDAFKERFFVATMPDLPDAIANIVKTLFEEYKTTYNTLISIPDTDIIEVASRFNYQNNWKPETRAKVIREKGSIYYSMLLLSEGKEVVSTEMYQDTLNCISALKESEDTAWYFADDNPFDGIKRYYQLKFKGSYNGIPLRCMMDLAVVDYKNKIVYPCDLKTSSAPEYKFYNSFIKWHYYIQAQLYWRILRDAMDADEYFKDFTLADYRFIVINRETLNPKVWEWKYTKTEVSTKIGEHNIPNWRELVTELHYYLTNTPKSPVGITSGLNDIAAWLRKEEE